MSDDIIRCMLLLCKTMCSVSAVSILLGIAQVDDNTRTVWPSVRGPHFNGHSDDTVQPQAWGDDGPPVLWVRKLGQGYSAFVADGDRVYTQAQHMTGQYVYCLEADTGETIWEHWYDWPYEAAGVYPGPRATPTLYEDRLYFTSPDGLLGCLAADTGRQIWSLCRLAVWKRMLES